MYRKNTRRNFQNDSWSGHRLVETEQRKKLKRKCKKIDANT